MKKEVQQSATIGIYKQCSSRRFLCHQAIWGRFLRPLIRMYLWLVITRSFCPSSYPCCCLFCCPSYGPSSCPGSLWEAYRGDWQSSERHHYHYPSLHHRNHNFWLPEIRIVSVIYVMAHHSIILACQNIPRVAPERRRVHHNLPCGASKRCQKL